MTEQAENQEAILERYADGPALLETAIAGLDESDLDLAQSDDSWSMRQIVHHVVDGDDIWQTAIKAALADGAGTFSLEWYWEKPQDEWVTIWHYAERNIEPSLELFRINRRNIVQLIRQIPDAWERRLFIHDPEGERMQLSLGTMVEMQADHVLGHIETIREIREMYGV
jgi:hypothetical protein